ncbi:hypothetical protein C8R43DRAFT_1137240 [Mycena crocata]|nr:hypothetical protein C8R43DRAFT_1137240 [Mycena crocata]
MPQRSQDSTSLQPTDPATAAQRLRRLKSSRDYNAENRDERNYKKRHRMALLRASRLQDAPELIEARRAAARDAARRYREKNRDTLAQKSQERRNELKIAKRRAEAKERRQRELAARRSVQGLPLAVPSSYSARERAVAIADHRRQQEEYVRMAEEGDSDDGEEGDSN